MSQATMVDKNFWLVKYVCCGTKKPLFTEVKNVLVAYEKTKTHSKSHWEKCRTQVVLDVKDG